MVKKLLSNPFVVSALLLALLFYSGKVKVHSLNPFKSAVQDKDLESIKGSLYLNPSKSSDGSYYSSRLKVQEASGYAGENLIFSKASGLMDVMLPSKYVESLYPGKLYSSSDSGKVIAEVGEKLELKGKFSKKSKKFYAEKVIYKGYTEGLWGKIMHFRAICRLNFKRLMYSWGKSGGMILSLLSGSREYLQEGVALLFTLSGLSHILALSGMHLSFFSSFADFSGKRLFGKKFSFYARLSGILFFVWFAGLSPSLYRALMCSLMMILFSFLHCKECEYTAVLAFVFIIHIIFFPQDMFSLAFIFSYLALLGILLFYPWIEKKLICYFGKYISSSLAASVSALLATFPVCLKVFGFFSPAGILASVIISPFTAFFILVSFLSIILSLLMPFLCEPFGIIMNLLYDLMIFTVRIFSFIPCIKF